MGKHLIPRISHRVGRGPVFRLGMPARHDTERAVRVELHGDRFLPHLLHQFPHGPNVGAIMSELGPSHHATSFGSASSDRSRMAIRSPVAVRLFAIRSEEHTSERQSLMSIPYPVFCLKTKK